MKKCYDPKKRRWLENLVVEVRNQARRTNPNLDPGALGSFDGVLVDVLQEVLAEGWAAGPHGGRLTALALLEDNLLHGRKTVVGRLKLAARFGAWHAITGRHARGRKNAPLELVVNPELWAAYQALDAKAGKSLAIWVAAMWTARRDFTGDVQGFDDTVAWGASAGPAFTRVLAPVADEEGREVVAAPGAPAAAGPSLRERIASARKDPKEERKRERLQWASYGEQFITASANFWVRHQQRQGFGLARPTWEGRVNDLAPTARRARSELVKLFEQYGGRTTGLAWILFCAGRQQVDEKGKVVMNFKAAHKQWTTPDKKPEHFAKHFSLILAEMQATQWDTDAAATEALGSYFGALASVLPRGQTQVATAAVAAEDGEPTTTHEEHADEASVQVAESR